MTPGTDDAKNWNPSLCFGRPRCGKRQSDAGFGVDTGFNFKGESKSQCQCPRSQESYQEIPKAKYTPGQKVCIAYPPKNHVAASCTNDFIPDTGVVISRSALNPTSDAFTQEYVNSNGAHVSGQADYKGFQNCPNFCADKDKSLCTMCFTLEDNLAPGEYTFQWLWMFNSDSDFYSTCWEAEVSSSGSGQNASPSAPSPSSSSPAVAPTTAPSPSNGNADCENGPNVPVNYPTPAPSPQDCMNSPNAPVSYTTGPSPVNEYEYDGNAQVRPSY
jgi:hypothetical protein